MRKALTILLAVATPLCAQMLPGSRHFSPITGSGFLLTKTITVNAAQVSGTQTNFPMLVSGTFTYLKGAASGGYVQNANGYDIVFTSDSGCATKLNWEVESYTPSSGQLIAWVKIPSLTGSTVIYMCYDNPWVTAFQGNVSGTWSSNYVAVYHLPNGTTLNTNDSTSNANNTTNNNSTPATTGEIDGAASFNGTNQYLSVASNASLNPTNVTVTAWIKETAFNNYARIASKGIDGDTTGYQFFNTATNGTFTLYINGGYETSNTVLSTGTWYFVAGTYDGTTIHVYLNGANNDGTGVSTSGNIASNTSFFGIGSHASLTEFFDGSIDEVEVQNEAVSASWILTEYNNQSSPSTFYTITP